MKNNTLKIDGIFLTVMGSLAGITDLASYFAGKGPFGETYFQNSIAIGGFEAHCLAVITGLVFVLKSKSSDAQFFNKIAIAIHSVLGICNLVWFEVFIYTNMILMGFVTTIAHFSFVAFNSIAISKKISSSVVTDKF